MRQTGMRATGPHLSSSPRTRVRTNWRSTGRCRSVTRQKSCGAARRRRAAALLSSFVPCGPTGAFCRRQPRPLLPSVLVSRAEDILRAWQIVAPARSTLEELVASVTAHVQDDVYTRITIGLRPEMLQAMDDLLQVPPGARRSMLFQLKEYPAEASYAVILRYIEHYHFLREFGVGTIDLGGIGLPMIRYLADQAKRYDVHTLRRFSETKRYG